MDFARILRGFCVGFARNLIPFLFEREHEGYKRFADCTVAEIVLLTRNYQSVLEKTLGVNLRAKPAVFSREKISFSLQLLLKPFLWAILN